MTNSGAGMPCPVCKVPLVMSDRQGVEIDYCPQCRGVWLDRGELDKIVDRSRPAEAPVQARPNPNPNSNPNQGYASHGDGYARSHGYPKKRKSFLEELFD